MIANLVFDAKTIETILADRGIVVESQENVEYAGRQLKLLTAHLNPKHEFWLKAYPDGVEEGKTKIFHIASDEPGFFWADFNFGDKIEYSGDYLVDCKYPSYNLKTGQYFTDKQVRSLYESKINFRDWPEEMGGLVNSYGVADNVEQVLEHFKAVVDNPEVEIALEFTVIRKKDQPADGGWRWHKWGEYIGTHEIQHEYLYDEEGVEEVMVYHVYPVKKKEITND